ncbi:Peroxin-3 [Parathielavia appendiculata]|uniref:Peroxin-3 n=1 Tax=Parathielavia appendiculata TaxID=2587402 RepID=A0AAN6TZL0_9PEZI|nr:Peroxin-3 [Parathielavia appendiculata]
MLAATRRWFRRNRTPIAIGVGVVGVGYVVSSYIVGKLRDARERMSSDRIAKENLRRRFEQNQEDCTFTVLALLPTATTNILESMDTEKITYEIQQIKGSATARTRSIGSTSPPSMSETYATDDDGRSIITVSAQSEAGARTTQLSVATPPSGAGPESGSVGVSQEALSIPQKPRKTKRQLWDDLTISSITRAYTLLYTLGLLTMLTRIQLNLLGRRSYLSSVVSLATGSNVAPGTISLENNDDDSPTQAYGTDFDVNRKYLTFSWWLLNRGWVDVMQRVEGAVRQVFGHLSPRDTVTLDTFAKLSADVRRLVEGSGPSSGASTNWLSFLLPSPDMEDFVLRESGVLDSNPLDPNNNNNNNKKKNSTPSTPTLSSPFPSSAASLRRLLDETADLIESPTFSHVLTQLLDAGFSLLLEQKLFAGILDATAPTTSSAASVDSAGAAGPTGSISRAVLLPKILSVLTRQAHVIGHGMPNEYLQAMESVRDLEGFAAVVYSSNWQAEIVQEEGEGVRDAKTERLSSSSSRPQQRQREQQQQQQQQQAREVSQGQGEGEGRMGSSSIVVVDSAAAQSRLFESAWEKASEGG